MFTLFKLFKLSGQGGMQGGHVPFQLSVHHTISPTTGCVIAPLLLPSSLTSLSLICEEFMMGHVRVKM
jgi:hypothetical protein